MGVRKDVIEINGEAADLDELYIAIAKTKGWNETLNTQEEAQQTAFEVIKEFFIRILTRQTEIDAQRIRGEEVSNEVRSRINNITLNLKDK